MDARGFTRGSRQWLDRNQRALLSIAVALAALVVLLVLAAKLVPGFPEAADLNPGRRYYTLDPTVRRAAGAIIFFDRPVVAAITVAVVAFAAWRHLGLPGALMAPAAASVVVVASVLKQLPPAGSLPSGHSSYAVAMFGFTAWLCLRKGRPLGAGLLVTLALVTGPAKVVVASHVPVDVVAGDALGVAWLIGVLLAGRALERRLRPAAAAPDVGYGAAIAAPGRGISRLDVDSGVEAAGLLTILLLPGALTIYYGFNAGGFFPGTVGVSVVVLAIALVARIGLAARPLAGLGLPGVVVAVALAAFTAWTLASGSWSDSWSRAIIEFDRALAYLLAFVLLASVAGNPFRRRVALHGVLVGLGVICLVGFLSRTAPDLVSSAPRLRVGQLSHPLTYWNAMGLAAALGVVMSLHVASAPGGRLVRALGAAALPLLAATMLLTFSRGALLAVVVGIVAYIALARERGVFFGALATLPAAAVAVKVAYDADLLATGRFASQAGQDQGGEVLLVVALCCAAAAALSVVLTLAEHRTRHLLRMDPSTASGLVVAGLALTLVAAFFAAGGPSRASSEWDKFENGDGQDAVKTRDRLTQVGNNGRIEDWKVARLAFSRNVVKGTGAGTYANEWNRERQIVQDVNDAHSLPFETASELGVIGAALLAVALGTLLIGVGARARGPDRAPYAVVAAAGVTWLVSASIDWDWEMPAITLWLFALGGLALARPPTGKVEDPRAGRVPRLVAMLVVAALAVLPVQTALSQARLNAAVTAFRSGDCTRAIDRSLAASSALPARPEPFQLLAFCDARLGRADLAESAARKAIDRDPGNWEFAYTLALVRGYAGEDPRRAAARARRLNPLSPVTRSAVRGFAGDRPARWRRTARTAPLPFK